MQALTTTMRRACLDRIEEAFVAAEAHYNVVLPRVPVEFSNQLKSTAGLAVYSRDFRTGGLLVGKKIKLSVPLLNLNGDEFIDRTPGHEAAHIIAATVHNEHGHGAGWKQVMRVIGQKAERCHQMKVATNRVDAHCSPGCTAIHKITKVRAGKMTRGATYICKICRQILKLDSADNTMVLAASTATPMPTVKSVHIPPAPKRVSKPGTSKADQVRTLIRNNPAADVEALILLVRASTIGVKPNLVRSYVKNNVAKLRG